MGELLQKKAQDSDMAGARCMKAKQTYEAACYVRFAYTLHLNLLSYPRLLEGDA